MRRLSSLLIGTAVALGGTVVAAPQAQAAGPFYCNGTYINTMIETDVVIAGNCTLRHVEVWGKVTVNTNANGAKIVFDNVSVVDRVRIEANADVTIRNSGFRSNLEILNSSRLVLDNVGANATLRIEESAGPVTVRNTEVERDLLCRANQKPVTLANNAVKGRNTCGRQRPSFKSVQTDLYTTPGIHRVNGRLWRTTCEPYSNTYRCRTEIEATQVVRRGNKYVPVKGWYFNNLTYLPMMTRAEWGSSPLANTGQWTSSGRQWRTECGTRATGRNSCRTYIETSVVEAVRTSKGTSYRTVKKWVVNNIVRFWV